VTTRPRTRSAVARHGLPTNEIRSRTRYFSLDILSSFFQVSILLFSAWVLAKQEKLRRIVDELRISKSYMIPTMLFPKRWPHPWSTFPNFFFGRGCERISIFLRFGRRDSESQRANYFEGVREWESRNGETLRKTLKTSLKQRLGLKWEKERKKQEAKGNVQETIRANRASSKSTSLFVIE